MTEQQFCKYLTNRFEDQRNWLDGKSIKYKWWHHLMMMTTIVLAGLAPLVTALVPVTAVPVVVSGLVSIIASLHQASRFKELWTTYRATSEALKREKYLFEAGIRDYREIELEQKRELFVERIEELLFREHALWVAGQERQDDTGTSPPTGS